jgi:hypothetical protein
VTPGSFGIGGGMAHHPRMPKSTQKGTGAKRAGRGRVVYVRSLEELTEDQRFVIRAIDVVRRSPRKGAPLTKMIKVEFYGERAAARMLELRKALADVGHGPERNRR